MSTPYAPESEALLEFEAALTPYDGKVIRVVEAQHRISTNRLARNAADQALLEALADEVKPALPTSALHLPWLLASPFRYGLGRPSRFRGADIMPGIFYASEKVETAITEAAYWRLLGFSRSPGFAPPATPTQMSAFSVGIKSLRAIDLTKEPFAKDHASWTHPGDYSATQALGRDARQAGVEVIRAPSARAIGQMNVVVLDPSPLKSPPRPHSSWAFTLSEDGLIATQELGVKTLRFTPSQFGL